MGLLLPGLEYTEAFGGPAVALWDLNLPFSDGLGQLKERQSHFALRMAKRRAVIFLRIPCRNLRKKCTSREQPERVVDGFEKEKRQHRMCHLLRRVA